MVDRQDVHMRSGVDIVADCNAALPAQHVELADEAILANDDAGMWQMAQIIDMQLGMVYDVAPNNQDIVRDFAERQATAAVPFLSNGRAES